MIVNGSDELFDLLEAFTLPFANAILDGAIHWPLRIWDEQVEWMPLEDIAVVAMEVLDEQ